MSPKQRVRCLAALAFAAATLQVDVDTARANGWSWSSDCRCSDPLPAVAGAGGWGTPRSAPPYNSSWKRVPVTNYRRLVMNDPLAGVRVTSLQPCNTSEWQMQRTAGCSFWQSIASWWKSHCCYASAPLMPPATTTCTPTSEWTLISAEPAASPYYSPSTKGRLVPVPSAVSPSSPVPADRRPQLNPLPLRSNDEGSAARLLSPSTEVFVRTLDGADTSLELVPPRVAPGSRNADADASDDLQHVPQLLDGHPDDRVAAMRETSLELLPVSWSMPTPRDDRKLPTNEVWDDTGWQSER